MLWSKASLVYNYIAASFLSNETVEIFVWLFKELKKCMEQTPITIIMDQDVAMKTTLLVVFPKTFHRLCKWHITNKMGDKIGNA